MRLLLQYTTVPTGVFGAASRWPATEVARL